MFISDRNYTTYENLNKEFGAICSSFSKIFPDVQTSRFGLRYVNIFDIDNIKNYSQWKKYISPQLVSSFAFFNKYNTTRILNVTEFKERDINVVFHYGVPNPDYPAMIRRPHFVIDIDASVQVTHELSDSMRFMDEAHGAIQNLFESCITKELRTLMGKPESE